MGILCQVGGAAFLPHKNVRHSCRTKTFGRNAEPPTIKNEKKQVCYIGASKSASFDAFVVCAYISGEVDEGGENAVACKQSGVAYKHQVAHGSCHRDVQLSVDPCAVEVFKDIACEESQLVVVLDGETVDDVLALAALKTLNGVDGDVAERRHS